MDKVSKEIAKKEVTAWLDYKKISQSKRDTYELVIEEIIARVQDGTFVINQDTFVIEQTLAMPLGSTGNVTKLSFKPRLSVGAIQDNLNGADPGAVPLTLSYIMALTGQPRAILKELDTEDYRIADLIAVFFAIAK